MITISPGHYGPKTGANGFIDEVTEAIRVSKQVISILRAAGIVTNYIEDNVNKSQKKNIPWLIAQHNKTSRQIDVSIHFNASAGTHSKGIGVETLIQNGDNIDLATKLTDAISNVSGLKNRGVKIRTDLGLLKGTNKACYLIEVCFVNDSVDAALYKRYFEKICQAIANELAKAVAKSLKPSTIKEKEVNYLEFSSATLKKETELSLDSKAHREIIVKAAIKSGAHVSWVDKLGNGTITDSDLLGLSMKVVIASNK